VNKQEDRLFTITEVMKLYYILGDREILEYFGMTNTRQIDMLNDKWHDRKTLKEIGLTYDLSIPRVRQIIESAVRQLTRNIRRAAEERSQLNSLRVRNKELENECELLAFRLAKFSGDNIASQLVKIEDVSLSVRAYNCLKAARINTLGDLTTCSAPMLIRFRNMGVQSINEIISIMERYGLKLKDSNG